MLELDPLAVAISMMTFGEDSTWAQDLEVASLRNQPLMSSEVLFYESHEELVEKAITATGLSQTLVPPRTDESHNVTPSNGNAGNGDGDINLIHYPLESLGSVSDCISEGRREKLSRYRDKRTRRNFGRNIRVNLLHFINGVCELVICFLDGFFKDISYGQFP
ncbi:hypothetical protein SAY86_023790 [Trapa natans]|uniref:Uncharacterized protein n=1 Tax=Trapa natans TaxID=22666 RepID=A0AAN7R9M9_TRANT|nr:hypothetical protein SAY86_023790 [Trapa natans]